MRRKRRTKKYQLSVCFFGWHRFPHFQSDCLSDMRTAPSQKNLSKDRLQELVLANDSSISLVKPVSAWSEPWLNFSQLHHSSAAQDYIVWLYCRIILKKTSENGTTFFRLVANPGCPVPKNIRDCPVGLYCRRLWVRRDQYKSGDYYLSLIWASLETK